MYSAAMRDLRQLQSFRSTALAGSVRGAAEHLATAPSAVSHQIRALEAELGLELFTRDRRRLVLTPTGRELLVDVERVFESLGDLEDRATELRDSRARRLVIGYFSSAGARWIADLVAYLENAHSDMSVRLRLTDGGIVEHGVDLQLVVSGDEELPLPPSMGSELLLVDPYVAAVPRDHPIANSSTVSLAALRDLPWIDNDDLAASNGRCRQVFIDACRTSGVDLSFRHQAHDYRTALDMVDRGLGATVLPKLGLTDPGDGTAVLDIVDPPMTRRIHAVWCTDGPRTDAVLDALRALKSVVGENH
ncbi:DNA-binding transcriptional regulator, LysR family [Brevibacterium jeotgali]|uniref:DNA-binding transcriptional regulator, LysR family n=2 Tax=Brevibacterium jeotgali TaxID=1262550 RepID=A0A2H1L6Z0_9MICO|nr:DNA-binding transcriptional LysR family regulator [Brevibacterium jeotgali]SMY12661.1 DNA-binding transcriptional regulator, LysR family [Brevibacterium jeotgali]